MVAATGRSGEGRADAAFAEPKLTSKWRADIQGLRGLAVLLVVAFHAGVVVPGGFVGVDVFFVISGLVITNLLVAELESTGRLRFRQFYKRRIRRLLPALSLLIVVVALAGIFLLSPLGTQQQTATLGRAAATFRANLSLYSQKSGYFDLDPNANPFLHTWSLAVEEQFYLLFPAFLLFAWSFGTRVLPKRSRRVGAAAFVAIGAAISLWLSADLTAGHTLAGSIVQPAQFAFYALPARAWEFAAGALLALGAPTLQRQRKDFAVAAGAGGLLLVVASARFMNARTAFPGTAALVPVVGAALILAAGAVTSRGVGRLLATKPAVWIGDLSYSWYLWHWPLIVFAAALWPEHRSVVLPIAAVAALGPSWLSYRYVERPFRIRAPWTRQRTLAIAAVCVALPLVAAAVLTTSSHHLGSDANVQSLNEQLRPHSLSGPGCSGVVQPAPRPACTKTPTGTARGEVWLLGDSQAGQLTEPVARAATGDGFALTVSQFNQCPFVDLVLVMTQGPQTSCHQFVNKTVDNLVARRPSLVIIASESSDYVDDAGFGLKDPHTGVTATTPSAKARLWQQGLLAVLQRFRQAKVPALVVNTIPHFVSWDPRTCPALLIAHDLGQCGTSRSLQSVRADQQRALVAERSATHATGADMVDFTDQLCPRQRCDTNRGDFFTYLNGFHLSVDGALTLTDDFARRITTDARAPTS